MQKRTFYTELSYLAGVVILALGTALMEKADFGMSMVVAPAYLLHLKISPALPFFSFGMAEYMLQGVILIAIALLMRRVKRAYILSFGTAVLYGLVLDAVMAAAAFLPAAAIAARAVYYVLGLVLCSLGVALLFHTYLPPEAYELFVKEIADRWKLDVSKTKTAYDCVSCAVSVALSFAFFGFGHFEGVKAGTILCALVNGTIIGAMSKALNQRFVFADGLKLRAFFEG